MGQDHSSGSIIQTVKGISPLAGRSGNTSNKIVVVRANEARREDPKQDPDVLKLQEIPSFYPILRSSMGIAGLKDPPDLLTKFPNRGVLALSRRLQDHLITTSEIVAGEQGALGTRVREIDYAIATLANFLSDRQKAFAKFSLEIQKVRELDAQLKRISAQFRALVPSALAFNQMLPESSRLPPPDFSHLLVEEDPDADLIGTSEQKVVDLTPSSQQNSPF